MLLGWRAYGLLDDVRDPSAKSLLLLLGATLTDVTLNNGHALLRLSLTWRICAPLSKKAKRRACKGP